MATIQVKVCHVSCTVTIRRLIPKIHGLVNPSHSEQHHLPALERLSGKASSPTQALFQENQIHYCLLLHYRNEIFYHLFILTRCL